MGLKERQEARQARKDAREARGSKRAQEKILLGGIMPAEAVINISEDPLHVCDRNMLPINHALRNMWMGCAAFYVCGGPSMKSIDLSFLKERGIVSLAINNAAAYAPVKAMAFSDPASKFSSNVFFDPAIIKFVPKPKLRERVRAKLPDGRFQWTAYTVSQCPSVFSFERDGLYEPETFLTRDKASWGVSKRYEVNKDKDKILCTFFIGLRLLHYLGVRRIYLLGVDFKMTPESQYAFGQSKHSGGVVSNNNSYRVATKMLVTLRPHLEAAGLEVFQTNPDSDMKAFDFVDLAYAIEDCRGLVQKEPYDLSRYYEKPQIGAEPAPEGDAEEDRGED